MCVIIPVEGDTIDMTKRTIREIFYDARVYSPRLSRHNVLPAEFVGWMLKEADEIEHAASTAWQDDTISGINGLEEQVTLPLSNVARLRALALEAIVEHGLFPQIASEGEFSVVVKQDFSEFLTNHSVNPDETLVWLGRLQRRIDLPDHFNNVHHILHALRARGYVLESVMTDQAAGLPAVIRVSARYVEDAEPQPASLLPLRDFLREMLAGRARIQTDSAFSNIVFVCWPQFVLPRAS
jgi:hypothetical protein